MLAEVDHNSREQAWLDRLVGDWIVTADTSDMACDASAAGAGEEAGEGQSASDGKVTWEERVTALGGTWIVSEGSGEMPGMGTVATRMTLGHDPQRNRIIGTWIGSMMAHMWVYDGELDADGRTVALNCEGQDCTDPSRRAAYQDIITLNPDGSRTLSARMQKADGTWMPIMEAHYTRKTPAEAAA